MLILLMHFYYTIAYSLSIKVDQKIPRKKNQLFCRFPCSFLSDKLNYYLINRCTKIMKLTNCDHETCDSIFFSIASMRELI